MKKTIFLVDMNSFFISCEALRHPEIYGIPAAVAGDPQNRRGIILTANYEARKFGVKTTMPIHLAQKICPNIILIPPDHNFYEENSKEVMKILKGYTPIIEQNSIDEAWLDMTGCEGLFGKPEDAAGKIMNQLKEDLGLWCSIGISENKFLSKMASEMKKPLGITTLWKDEIVEKLWPLSLRKIYGVGSHCAEKLEKLGLQTIGDVATSEKSSLIKELGKFGGDIFNFANGDDSSMVVQRKEDQIKSIGRSITLGKDITNFDEAKIIILRLSEELGAAARTHCKKGSTVQINIKYSDFQSITRQTVIHPTNLTKDIYSAGSIILKKNWNNRPVRLLGISLTGFSDNTNTKQLSLFDLSDTKESEANLENAIDSIRKKYGDSIVKRAVFIKKDGEK